MEEMAEDNLFITFHRYKRLVEDGKARAIRCPNDNSVVIIGHDDGELRLVCYVCNIRVTPGLSLIQQVQAVVKEHYL
jgi:hypothetical protein